MLPVIDEGPYGFEHVNVAQQRRDPNSLLNWTERIIRMRKEVPEIGWGGFTVLSPGTPEVFALRYDWRNNAFVAVHNLGAAPREISLKVEAGHDQRRELVIFCPKTIAAGTTAAGIASCSNPMVIAGTASAAWIIC